MIWSLELPWPPRGAAPNASVHPHTRTAARRGLRRDAGVAAAWAPAPPAGELVAVLVFRPPDRRRRDLDNLIASMKGALDGVFEWHERDDSDVVVLAGAWGPLDRGRGSVELRLAPAREAPEALRFLALR